MSETEIKRRHDYKRNRKRWIAVQAVALVLAVIIAIGAFLVYNNLNKTYYIEYTENGSVDYKVHYTPNDFFEEEWIGRGQSYVTELIDGISLDFAYMLNMDTTNVGFDYTYDVVAELVVADKTTGHAIYNPGDVLIPTTTESVSGSGSFNINKNVVIDFASYNNEAQSFIKVYALKNATASLNIRMNVNVLSSSDAFESNNSNAYYVYMNIPLCQENFSITSGSSVATEESKVLACKGAIDSIAFLNTSVFSGGTALVLLLILIIFVHATRNEDVNYTIKVQKLVRAYRSFIQQMEGDFDSAGYQIITIKTFTEMLGIRDTIQSPILMSENRDQTKTQFLIPTNTKLLYLFEIKVDNYDEIYKRIEEENAANEPECEPVCEFVCDLTKAEPDTEAAKEEPALEDAPDFMGTVDTEVTVTVNETYTEDDGDESIVYYDENNNKLLIQCRRSCLANIIQSENEGTKSYYSELKNHILSYKGVKARMSWKYESFKLGRTQLFKLKIRGKTICLYCALNPEEFEASKYFHEAVEAKTFEQVPMLVRIRSDRGLARAKKLIDILMEKKSIAKNEKYEASDFVKQHPYERTQALIDRGLIKILIPDGYVVVDPHHVISAAAQKKAEELKSIEQGDINDDAEEIIEYVDENNNKLKIKCRRSCLANIIQSDTESTKTYYSELKNYILSHKGVKARMSWKYESYNLGRRQLFKLKIRGKTICLYCALNPASYEENKYFHEAVEAKTFEQVPMLVRIRSDRGLARAKKLVDDVIAQSGAVKDAKFEPTDYTKMHLYTPTKDLIEQNLIKILL